MSLKLDEKLLSKEQLYVVAVSGGVDSIVLLDLLAKSNYKVIVAHAQHGLRAEDWWEAALVQQLAASYDYEFNTKKLKLASNSEDSARRARYEFLSSIQQQHGAAAVITAHHRDDVIETMLLNLKRGSSWRGLVALRSRKKLIRPLLGASKAQILQYAADNRLEWLEDDSNQDTKYRRNQLRRVTLPKLKRQNPNLENELLNIYSKPNSSIQEIDKISQDLLDALESQRCISRTVYRQLPDVVRREILMQLLKKEKVPMKNIDAKKIAFLDSFVIKNPSGKSYSPHKSITFKLSKEKLCYTLLD